jgi:hypothetical protein
LGFVGGVSAFVAAIMGIRMGRPNSPVRKAQLVQGPDKIIDSVVAASWVLFFGSLAILAGVGIQVSQLIRG